MNLAIGIDVGGTKIFGTLIDLNGEIKKELKVPTPDGGDAVIKAVAEVIRELSKTASFVSVGLSIPGFIDRSGVVRFAPNAKGLQGLDVGKALRHELNGEFGDVAIWCGNDANAAAWAEFKIGAGRGVDDLMVITLGTGIGSGFVVNGELMQGGFGFAGEAGHMVVQVDGWLCPCGRRGCWERYASGSGLAHFAQDAARRGDAPKLLEELNGNPEAVKGEHVIEAARNLSDEALNIVNQYAPWVALGLANLTAVMDPARVVLSGGLVEAADVLFEKIRSDYRGQIEAIEHREGLDIVPALLGTRAGTIGAGLMSTAGL